MKTLSSSSRFSRFVLILMMAVTAAMLVIPQPVSAQQTDYRISVNRNFGFSSGSQIRGDFTVSIIGDETTVQSVAYLIDGQAIGEVAAAPFKLRFKTQDYPEGVHEIGAVITLKDGSTVTPQVRRFEFVSAEVESSVVQKIIFPLLGVVLLMVVLGTGSQMLAARRRGPSPEAGFQRNYGLAGGSICPKCMRPTPRHMWGLNMVVGKLDRCENCGKWSIMRAQPIEVLRAAERAEIEAEKADTPKPAQTEEERLRELLDRSRYTN